MFLKGPSTKIEHSDWFLSGWLPAVRTARKEIKKNINSSFYRFILVKNCLQKYKTFQMVLSTTYEIQHCFAKNVLVCSHIINSLLTELVRSGLEDISLVLFLFVY